MKEAPKTWRITHYPAGVAPSRDYAVRAYDRLAARESSGPGGAKEGEAVVVPSEGNEVRREGRREVGVG